MLRTSERQRDDADLCRKVRHRHVVFIGWNIVDNKPVGHSNAQDRPIESAQEAVVVAGPKTKPAARPIERQAGHEHDRDLDIGDSRTVGNRLLKPVSVRFAFGVSRVHREIKARFGRARECEGTEIVIDRSGQHRCKIRLACQRRKSDDPTGWRRGKEPGKSHLDPTMIDLQVGSVSLRSRSESVLFRCDITRARHAGSVGQRAPVAPAI